MKPNSLLLIVRYLLVVAVRFLYLMREKIDRWGI